jgi:predicted ester cyclase
VATRQRMTPERVVRAYIDAYNNHDPDLAMIYLTDDFERYSNTTKEWDPMFKDRFKEMWVSFQNAFPDFKWDVVDIVCSGNTVAIEVIETGRFTNLWVMPGITIKPTGKSYRSYNSLFFHVKDGLIQNYHQYASPSFLEVGIPADDIDKSY